MGILDNIGIGKKTKAVPAQAGTAGGAAASRPGARTPGGPVPPKGRMKGRPPGAGAGKGSPPSKGKGRGRPGKKGRAVQAKTGVSSAAAPLHDRRRRLVAAREATLRDLGGLMLEMYKRNRFREELLLDKCEEILAIEVEIAHIDQRLFQLAPPNAAGMRPIGRCECGAPIHPGQNFCGVCGRGFGTLTQSRNCERCGTGLRPGDQFCATCGTEAPDVLQALEAPAQGGSRSAAAIDASSLAASAVADTVIIEAASIEAAPPPLEDAPSTPPLDDPAARPARASEPAAPAAPTTGDVVDAVPSTPPIDVAPSPGVDPVTDAPDHGAPTDPEVPSFNWTAAAPTMPPPADPEPAAAPAPDAPPQTPALAEDAAIEAALDAAGQGDAGSGSTAAFTSFPMTASVPPPPVPDEADLTPPALASEAVEATIDPPFTPASAPAAEPVDEKAAKAAEKRRAKQLAALRRAKAKQAKDLAKQMAKEARDSKKRGGS